MLASPSITVITVNFNDCDGLARTINSVNLQDYTNYQYVVVDGASTDGSIDLINNFEDDFFHKIIEHDIGIYHAMNKAIAVSDSEWLLFMNSGDTFFSEFSLSSVMSKANDNIDVIYADWVYLKSGKKVNANKSKMNVRHQSIIYRRSLHDIYGTYVVAPNLTISDYIFFSSISDVRWCYYDEPLSICDEAGVSSNVAHFYQRNAVDFLFSKYGKYKLIAILLLHPIYHKIKKYFV